MENNEDCNDQNEYQSPGILEVCNEADDDCNGSVDDNPIDPLGFYLTLMEMVLGLLR